MALDGLLAGELLRDDAHVKMPAAVTRTGVTGMARAVIDYFDLGGPEGGFQLAADQRNARGRHALILRVAASGAASEATTGCDISCCHRRRRCDPRCERRSRSLDPLPSAATCRSFPRS